VGSNEKEDVKGRLLFHGLLFIAAVCAMTAFLTFPVTGDPPKPVSDEVQPKT
jgi:hypothetical protein